MESGSKNYGLYKALLTGSSKEWRSKLEDMMAAFDNGEDELRGELSHEVANAFEHFCHAPWSASQALAVLRGAGRVIEEDRLVFGINRAAENGNEEIIGEALAFIAPSARPKALREALPLALHAQDRGFSAKVQEWAQALEDQLELGGALAPGRGEAGGKPRL